MKNHWVHRLIIAASAMLAFTGLAASAAAAEESAKNAEPAVNIAGRWVYRSIKNIADPAEDLSKMKLLVGIIEIPPYTGNRFTGTLTATNFGKDIRHVLHGEVHGDRFTMRADAGNQTTEGWVYDYAAWVVPKWKDGLEQVPTFVGSVLRVTEHPFPGGGTSVAGASYTIIGMKKLD